jgi:HEAT repeat protein
VVAILKDADPARVGMHLMAAIRAERRSPTGEKRASAQGPGLAQLLRLHGTAHAEALRPAVLEVLNAPADAEVLAAALGALWHPVDVAHVRAHLEHPDWVVRVAAAHALRRLGEREDLPRLSRLLADGNWWVRHRAAQALCALPGVALEELRQLRGSLTDRYAADALAQALADRAA